MKLIKKRCFCNERLSLSLSVCQTAVSESSVSSSLLDVVNLVQSEVKVNWASPLKLHNDLTWHYATVAGALKILQPLTQTLFFFNQKEFILCGRVSDVNLHLASSCLFSFISDSNVQSSSRNKIKWSKWQIKIPVYKSTEIKITFRLLLQCFSKIKKSRSHDHTLTVV